VTSKRPFNIPAFSKVQIEAFENLFIPLGAHL
jgi:hypothetical protein